MLVRFLQGGNLEIKNQHGVHEKPVAEGTTYPVAKVVFSKPDDGKCDIYFEGQGCAEDVPTAMIELHGTIDAVEYKSKPKPDTQMDCLPLTDE